MILASKLTEYIRACFTGLWIESHEHEDALTEIAQLCRQEDWRLAVWDVDAGLQLPGQSDVQTDASGSDPLAAIRSLSAMATPEGTALLVLTNFHRFIQSAEIVQALARQIALGKQHRTIVVVLSPVVDIPVELQKLIVVVEHDLPDRGQLEEIARGIATEDGELPEGDGLATVLDAAAGLTRYEAEGAFSLSLVREQAVQPESVWELKSQMLKKIGLLSLHRGSDTFDGLGGLDALKSFCLRSMRQQGNSDPLRRPRGVLLLSPPGCGKSAFAKCLGNEVGRPTITLDVGSLYGSLVGETERNVRQTIQTIDAMAPCVCFIDELEKGLSGSASSGQTDSGVAARLFGSVLQWMNDRTSDVYLVGTCNDIQKLPPEFARAERWDAVYFLDLPGSEQRQGIWEIHLEAFGLDVDQQKPNDESWTGAEIRSCCRLAALLEVSLVEAAMNVVPVAHTAAESVEQLRKWAGGRCLDAEKAGVYEFAEGQGGKRSRQVVPGPSKN